MTFQRFEDVIAWQTARKLVRAIYAASARGGFASDFGLRDQVRRAAVSMMGNVAEGLARRSDREFVQYLFMGKSSAAELQSHLYVALDQGYLLEGDFREMFSLAELYAKQISGLISFLTGRRRPSVPLQDASRP